MSKYDDPRLTAYILDELQGEERREFELLLEQDAQLRAELESLRAASETLSLHLSQDGESPGLELGDRRREDILRSQEDSSSPAAGRPFLSGRRQLLALAAGLILTVSLFVTYYSADPQRLDDFLLSTGLVQSSELPPITPPSAERGALADQAGAGPNRPEARQDSGASRSGNARTVPGQAQSQQPQSQQAQSDVSQSGRTAQSADAPPGEAAAADGDRRAEADAAPVQDLGAPSAAPAGVAAAPPPAFASRDLERGRRQPASPNVEGFQDPQMAQAVVEEEPQRLQPKPAADRLATTLSKDERKKLPLNARNRMVLVQQNAAGEAMEASKSQFIQPGIAGNAMDFASAQPPPVDREGYDHIEENRFQRAAESPLSTFSIDVDTASYSNVRRFLSQGARPPRDAVRIEELINYFSYDYPQPSGPHPFSVSSDLITCPWQPRHYLLRVGLQGLQVDASERPPSNLVFLIDTSGSMNSPDKLPLLQDAFRLLSRELRPQDQIAIVTYAGSAGLVLPSTPGSARSQIEAAINRLRSGGSTNGAGGIRLAYQTARDHFIEGGINRVLLATDGDFNVGVSSQGELVRLIEQERESGVFLTVLGFGRGNLQDSKMEQLADHGNGLYAYIDSLREARKTLVEGAGGALMTIAKDVKIQVEFNPLEVGAYRLVGYENRRLRNEDFNDDRKDAGEIGAGHSVTALYEIIPAGLEGEVSSVDALRYQRSSVPSPQAASGELAIVKLRYKQPDQSTSLLLQQTVEAFPADWRSGRPETQMAASAAVFGMLLRDSQHAGQATPELAEELALAAMAFDPNGHRAEFLSLLRSSRHLLSPQD